MKLYISHPDCISVASEFFRQGKIVVFPTDTVYGLGTIALKSNDAQIQKIYTLKERDYSKPLSLLITKDMINRFLNLPIKIIKLLDIFWPGSLTIIFPTRSENNELSSYLNITDVKTIAFRVPNSKILLAIISKVGSPIIGTSANISGNPPVNRIDDLVERKKFKSVDLWIDGGVLPKNPPSTVIDFSDFSNPVLLREGAVNFKDILEQIL